MSNPKPKLLYLGGGFLPGIPARDLYQTDIDNRRIDVAVCLASGLYYEPPKQKAVKDGEESEQWPQAE